MSRTNTHNTEVTAGDLFGDTYVTDAGDTYPLLAHSDYSSTWPTRFTLSLLKMRHIGLAGGVRIIIRFYLAVITLEKTQTVGRKYLAGLYRIWMFTWNLMIGGLIAAM